MFFCGLNIGVSFSPLCVKWNNKGKNSEKHRFFETFRKSFEYTLQIFSMATWPPSLGKYGEAQGGSFLWSFRFAQKSPRKKKQSVTAKCGFFWLRFFFKEFMFSKAVFLFSVLHHFFFCSCLPHFGGSLHRKCHVISRLNIAARSRIRSPTSP